MNRFHIRKQGTSRRQQVVYNVLEATDKDVSLGPRTDPCGTPNLVDEDKEEYLFMDTLILLFG